MSKYIKKFEEVRTYYDEVDGLVRPNVSYCRDNNKTYYNKMATQPYIIRYYSSKKLDETTAIGDVPGLHINAFSGTTSQDPTHTDTPLTILSHTFSNGVGTIVLNGDVKMIGENAFYGCTTISRVDIPEGVINIEEDSFKGCTNLSNVEIPTTVEDVAAGAFEGCKSLKKVTYRKQSRITRINVNTYYGCKGLREFEIPEDVQSIGTTAFKDCINLTEIIIPSGVTEIQRAAFDGCIKMEAIVIKGTTIATLGERAFDNTNECPIYVPDGKVAEYKAAWPQYAHRIGPYVSVSGVTLDQSTLNLGVETDGNQLAATVMPENAYNKNVVWTSSDGNIVMVDEQGYVTGLTVGNAIVTVTTVEGGYDAQCDVTVSDVVDVTSVSLDKTVLDLNIGDSETLVATVLPRDASNKSVTWASSDGSIVIVNSNGYVTAIAAGNAVITVTTVEGGFTAQCSVSVTTPVTSVTLDQSTLNLNVGDTSTLVATVLPSDATDKSVTWSSSDSTIATVDANGLVTAVANGSATITVTTNDGGLTAQCSVSVTTPVTSVSLDKTTLDLNVGDSETLVATVLPSNASDKSVTWASSDDNIASVDANGIVTAVADGSATITVRTIDGGFTAQCSVSVTTPVTSVSLDETTLDLNVGDTSTLVATVLPSDATDKSVTWSSSDSTIATVDANGLVTAVANGSATITVTTNDGGLTAQCSVSVTTPVTSVSLDQTVLNLNVGDTSTLSATVLPNDATDKSVTWSTSDSGIATVDSDGKVTAVANGDATITVTTTDGGFTAQCSVSVTTPILVSVISYSASSQLNVDLTAFTPAATAETFADGVGKIEFAESVTEIGYRAFFNKDILTSIDIPNSVTSIGNYAFKDCSGLTSIDMPNSLTTIGNNAFEDCSGLTSVIIPDSVTSLGTYAFGWCAGLTSVTIGTGLTSISEGVFRQCASLTSISIPNSVTSIGNQAFFDCENIATVTLPSSLTTIGDYVFWNWYALTSVTIPSSVTSIGSQAFISCSALTSITCEATTPPSLGGNAFENTNSCPIYVPCESVSAYKAAENWSEYESRITCLAPITYTASSKLNVDLTKFTPAATSETYDPTTQTGQIEFAANVTEIGVNAFGMKRDLMSIELPNSVTTIGNGAFGGCSGLTSATIGNGVTSIGQTAFMTCPSLQSIDIPSGVTSIGNWAFDSCTSLTSITCEAATPPTLGNNAFANTNDCPIYVPCENVNDYKSAWSAYASRIQCVTPPPVSVSRYSASSKLEVDLTAFTPAATAETYDSTTQTGQIEFNALVTEIGEDAFYGQDTLTSIEIPDSVTSIGNGAFHSCTALTSVTIGTGVTSIGEDAFNDCSSLTSIDIPDSVTSISNWAFMKCGSLTSCTIGSGVTSIGENVFYKCGSLTSIEIPSGVTSIGDYAFQLCTGLTSITCEATTPPTLDGYGNAFNNGNNCPIYVPSGSVNAYKTAWSKYASRIQAKP